MSIQERNELLRASIPERADDPCPRRYALRRSARGLELYEAKYTEMQGNELVFHGYPTTAVPCQVLRRLKDEGLLSEAEYRRLVRANR